MRRGLRRREVGFFYREKWHGGKVFFIGNRYCRLGYDGNRTIPSSVCL